MTPTVSLAAADPAVGIAPPPPANSDRRRGSRPRPGSDPPPATASRDVPSEDDRAALLLSHLDSPQAIHLAEAANLARPILKYLATPPNHRLVPFDRAWLVALHREMFGDVWAWAGRIRDLALDGGVAPDEIGAAMTSMIADRDEAIANSVPSIERSAQLLARAWSIRPFHHGNGRWARLLVDIDLALFRDPTIAWPNDSAARPILREAVEASRRGDPAPLEILLRRWQRG